MLRTFRIGGIHPPENKLSAGKKITALAARINCLPVKRLPHWLHPNRLLSL